MVVCSATLFSPTKGKSTWGVEIQQYNPILVDGVHWSLRCLPIARSTLIYALDSALPRRWPSAAPFAAFPSYALR